MEFMVAGMAGTPHRKQTVDKKWGQAMGPQGPPTVTHFLR